MNKKLKLKIHESLSAVIPITLIVLALGMTVVPMELSTLMLFLAGAALLILGMGFFTLGADMAMMPIGEQVGRTAHSAKKAVAHRCSLLCHRRDRHRCRAGPAGTGRPDARRAGPACSSSRWPPAWGSSWWWRSCASFSDGTFPSMLMGFYIVVFAHGFFVPDEFLAVAFDSGGVTTGPITVPFIMALGMGLASVRRRQKRRERQLRPCGAVLHRAHPFRAASWA